MNRKLVGNIIRFILLAFAQIYIFNKIQVSGYINPQVYVLFILMLPFEISGFWLLTFAFIMGLTIDFFQHTPGMHAAASVMLAFFRPGIIRLVGKKDDLEPWHYPNVRDAGSLWFLTYAIILVFLHHLFLFYLEVFRFSEFIHTLLKVLINTVLTSLIIMLIQYLFYSRRPD
ncbi:MAG: rod shape-determining protein MreD [Bacteroidales bacterium]|nr:rod shape-determining protein MreD [Bacteroidales bacterium]